MAIDTTLTYYSRDTLFLKILEVQSQQNILNEKLGQSLLKEESNSLMEWVTNDAVLTTITTLFVVFLGLILNAIYDYTKNCTAKKRLRRYFKSLSSKILVNHSKRLEEAYRNFYLTTSVNSGIPLTPPRILNGNIQYLFELDKKDFFLAHSDKEVYLKVINNIYGISQIIQIGEDFHQIVLGKSSLIRIELNQLTEEYITLIAWYTEKIKNSDINYEDNATYKIIGTAMTIAFSIKGKDLTHFFKHVNRPIQNHLVQTQLYKTDEKALEIANLGKSWSYKYNQLRRLTVEMKIEYRRLYMLLLASNSKLSIDISKLK